MVLGEKHGTNYLPCTMNEPILFIYRKEGGRQSEQSKKSEI